MFEKTLCVKDHEVASSHFINCVLYECIISRVLSIIDYFDNSNYLLYIVHFENNPTMLAMSFHLDTS
jgi:hypothetical protein